MCTQCGKVLSQAVEGSALPNESRSRNTMVRLEPRVEMLNNLITGRFSTTYAWRVLGRVSADFNLSYEARIRLVEEYENYLSIARRRGLDVGKKVALLGLLVYLELKRTRRRANLKEVARVLRLHGVRVHTGDLIRVIPVARELGVIRDGWDAEMEDLLEKVSQLAPRSELERHVKIIMGRIRRLSAGRSRRNVSAAIIVHVLRRLNVNVNLYLLSKLLRVPYSSLRSNVELVESLLLEVGLEQYIR